MKHFWNGLSTLYIIVTFAFLLVQAPVIPGNHDDGIHVISKAVLWPITAYQILTEKMN